MGMKGAAGPGERGTQRLRNALALQNPLHFPQRHPPRALISSRSQPTLTTSRGRAGASSRMRSPPPALATPMLVRRHMVRGMLRHIRLRFAVLYSISIPSSIHSTARQLDASVMTMRYAL